MSEIIHVLDYFDITPIASSISCNRNAYKSPYCLNFYLSLKEGVSFPIVAPEVLNNAKIIWEYRSSNSYSSFNYPIIENGEVVDFETLSIDEDYLKHTHSSSFPPRTIAFHNGYIYSGDELVDFSDLNSILSPPGHAVSAAGPSDAYITIFGCWPSALTVSSPEEQQALLDPNVSLDFFKENYPFNLQTTPSWQQQLTEEQWQSFLERETPLSKLVKFDIIYNEEEKWNRYNSEADSFFQFIPSENGLRQPPPLTEIEKVSFYIDDKTGKEIITPLPAQKIELRTIYDYLLYYYNLIGMDIDSFQDEELSSVDLEGTYNYIKQMTIYDEPGISYYIFALDQEEKITRKEYRIGLNGFLQFYETKIFGALPKSIVENGFSNEVSTTKVDDILKRIELTITSSGLAETKSSVLNKNDLDLDVNIVVEDEDFSSLVVLETLPENKKRAFIDMVRIIQDGVSEAIVPTNVTTVIEGAATDVIKKKLYPVIDGVYVSIDERLKGVSQIINGVSNSITGRIAQHVYGYSNSISGKVEKIEDNE